MVDGDGVAGRDGAEPSVFIVKYSYDPSEMSPNPNHEAELTLVAGDYIYVYGEMDGDGFYHAQLTTGEEGLVPSNFIELVVQGEGIHIYIFYHVLYAKLILCSVSPSYMYMWEFLPSLVSRPSPGNIT